MDFFANGGKGQTAIGRLCAIAQTSSGCTTNTNPYATGYGYNTAFELTGFNYANGVAASFGFSPDRLQMTSLSYMKGTTTLHSLNYSYGTAGSNNGQIQGITDNVDNGRSVTFSYDTLARLTNAVTTGSTGYPKWGLSWVYDAFGNRTQQNISSGCTGLTCPTNSVVVSAATNRITTSGYAYDTNGNMINDGVNTLTYDAENHLLTSGGSLGSGTYTYDGNGLRVKKVSASTTTVYSFLGSQVIAEYVNGAAPASPTREYIYSGSARLAKIEGAATQYYHSDHLSARLMTDSGGNKIGEQGHFPYGESWYLNNSATKWEFTSYERDSESGNDYAMARYSVNRLGRFSSPDLLSGSTGDPHSLNRYTYVLGDPVNHFDPSGLDCQEPTQDQTCTSMGNPSMPNPALGTNEVFLDGVQVSSSIGQLALQIGFGAYGPMNAGYGNSVRGDNGRDYTLILQAGAEGWTWINDANDSEISDAAAKELGLGVPSSQPDQMEVRYRASLMLWQKDCADFLTDIAQKVMGSIAKKNKSTVSPEEEKFATSGTSWVGLSGKISNANYVVSNLTPSEGGYVTVAHTDMNSNTVTLFAPYTGLGATEQAQTLIHEAMHLTFGFGDQDLGAAATGKTFGASKKEASKASAAFQAKLKQHCK